MNFSWGGYSFVRLLALSSEASLERK